MKTYQISYRDKQGAVRQIEVEADNRAGVFPLLENKGITPIRIKELERASNIPAWFAINTKNISIILGGIFICCGIGFALRGWFSNGKGGDAKVPPPRNVRSYANGPSTAPSNKNADRKGNACSGTGARPPSPPKPVLVQSVTNDQGYVIEDIIMPDGKSKRIVNPPKPVWDNAADQLIAMAISIEPGVEAPPLPSGVRDEEFLRALKKDIVIHNDDSKEIREIKQRVRETRNEILRIMASTGKTFEEVLNDHRSEMNKNTEMFHLANESLRQMKQEGADEEDIDKFVEIVNSRLRASGARELGGRKSKRPHGRKTNKGSRQ